MKCFHILKQCHLPCSYPADGFDSKGFWRLDRDKNPELRYTVLTLVAFHDLEARTRTYGEGKGIEDFLGQNQGEGWLLPETLCLADYGLGPRPPCQRTATRR